jgi:peptidyl-prolyl cis-trans isomerase C
MSCAIHSTVLPNGKGVRVNGIQIPRDVIAREVQHHAASTPAEGWKAAAESLVVRELLAQEARRLGITCEPLVDSEGRRETVEEAATRGLIEQEIRTPDPDPEICRRYYEQNRRRFHSADIYEAAHILFSASKADAQGYARAKSDADAALAQVRAQPERFAEFARTYSACPSGAQGGNLGQITPGQTTPEFEHALIALEPGAIAQEPVATRYGFHIIRLDRRIEGRQLPFDLVAERIADYLRENVERRAIAQYVARLASRSTIDGVTLRSAEALRVH